MAGEKIKHSDLIEDKVFDPTIKSGEEMLVVINKLKTGFVDLMKTSKDFKSQGTPKNVSELEAYEKKLRDIADADKSLIAIEKEKIRIEQELVKLQVLQTKATQESLKAEALYNSQIEKTAKAEAKKLKEFEKANSEYALTVKRLSEVKKELKDLAVQGITSGKAVENLQKQFNTLDTSVREAEEGVGEFQRNVGNYPKQLKEMQRALQGLEPGTAEFIKLSKEAGALKDKINDAKDATRAFASGSKTQTAKTLFGQIGSDLKDLDFAGAADKSAQFASVIKSISFSEVIGGIKNLGTALLNVGKALLANPFVLTIAAITGIILAVKAYSDSLQENTKVLEANNEAIQKVKENITSLQNEYDSLVVARLKADGTLSELDIKRANAQAKYTALEEKQYKDLKAAALNYAEELGIADSKNIDAKIRKQKELKKRLLELAVVQNAELRQAAKNLNEEIALIDKEAFQASEKVKKEETEKVKKDTIQKAKEVIDLSKELRDAETANITDSYDRQRAELTNKFNDDYEKYKSNSALIIELTIKLERDLLAIDAKQKAEAEALEAKHLEELTKMRKAQGDYEEKLKKDQADKDKKRREQEVQDNFRTAERINQAIADALKQRSQQRQDAITQEQQANETAIQKQQDLAARGLDNQLAFEEKKKAELALKLKQEKEKERKQEEAAQLASAFLEFLKERSKENPNTAPARALSDVLIAKAIGKTISGLYEGSESVGEEHAFATLPQSKDNLLVPLHKGERVVGFEDSQRIKGLTNKELVHAGELYKTGFFTPEIQDVSRAQQVNDVLASMLSKKITELNNTLKNKREYSVNWDSHGNRVEQVVEAGMKQVIKKVSTGKARI